MRVLEIDAWVDDFRCPNCDYSHNEHTLIVKCRHCGETYNDYEGLSWTWNNWFNVGFFEGNLNELTAMEYFRENFKDHLTIDDMYQFFEIEDDLYNIVLVDKKNRRPLYAIEYGAKDE